MHVRRCGAPQGGRVRGGAGNQVVQWGDDVAQQAGPRHLQRAGVVLLAVEPTVGVRLTQHGEYDITVLVRGAQRGAAFFARVVLEPAPHVPVHGTESRHEDHQAAGMDVTDLLEHCGVSQRRWRIIVSPTIRATTSAT